MRVSLLPWLLLMAIGTIGATRLSAQAQRWIPIAELADRVTAMEVVNSSSALIATSKPSLMLLKGDSIVWTLPLDTVPLPYFDYPHGDIVDIFLASEDEVWLAFQYGHAMRVSLLTREFRQLELRPVHGFARSGNRTIVAGSRFRSTDGGASWDTIEASTRPALDFATVVGGSGGLFYASNDTAGFWASTDGGVTWSERPALRNTPDSLTGAGRMLFLFDDQTIVVGAGNMRVIEGRNKGLYKSTDAGGSWHLVFDYGDGFVFGTAESARDGARAFIGSRNEGEPYLISMTLDEGDTWVPMNDGIDNSSASSAVFAMRGENILAYIEGNEYILYRLTTPSGVNEDNGPARATMLITPNSTTDAASVIIGTFRQTVGTLEVFDASGELVSTQGPIECPAGTSRHALELSRLPAGVYRVRFVGGHGIALSAEVAVVR